MKFCPQCGRSIDAPAKFCPHCGAAQPPIPSRTVKTAAAKQRGATDPTKKQEVRTSAFPTGFRLSTLLGETGSLIVWLILDLLGWALLLWLI